MNVRNVPIIGKVMIVIGLFAAVSIASAVFATGKLREIADGYAASIDQQGRTALFGARSNRALATMRAAVAELEIAVTDEGNRRAEGQLDAARVSFQHYMDIASQGDPAATATLKDIAAKGRDIIDVTCKTAIDLGVKANDPAGVAGAQAEYLKSCGPAFQSLTDAVTKTIDESVIAQDKIKAELAALSQNTILTTYAVILGGTVLVTLFSFFAIRAWLSRPVKEMAATMKQLAGGDLSVAVAGAERRDEIGLMAGAVQIFKDNGMKLKESEAFAASARQQAEAERTRNEATKAEAARQQRHVVEAIANGLEQLADGSLVFRIDEAFAAEYEKLRSDFNGAMGKLQETMKVVSGNTIAIRSGSAEISSAADDLARRTEQQAASLEETAAALDEITATVRKTAEGSKHARDVVGQAKKDAEHSGKVVRQAVDAMSGIERSANQISQIIGVIDEIAFQTNLLALNAGVEAARAGEAGRGFAVVASEVRALAQRSADAAKEIKMLISASSSHVETGVDLVGQTGKALEGIVRQITEINGIVAEIAASAQEQATGLDQVNTAVNQMDQVTQQNAAMVEESTAASHALSRETEELSALIGSFQVGQPPRQSAPSHSTARGGAMSKPTARVKPMVAMRTIGSGGAARKLDTATDWQEF